MKAVSILLAMLCSVSGLVLAESKTYAVDTDNSKNQIMFESDAPMETVVGKTSSVWGSVQLDPENLSGDVSGKIEVDLRTIDTGIGMRNEHMRKNHLETDTYPTASFTLKKIAAAESNLADGTSAEGTADGTFEIHGVAKDYSVPVTLVREMRDGKDHLWVHANWSILLQDHQIKRPEFLVMKLAEEQKISVQFDLIAQ